MPRTSWLGPAVQVAQLPCERPRDRMSTAERTIRPEARDQREQGGKPCRAVHERLIQSRIRLALGRPTRGAAAFPWRAPAGPNEPVGDDPEDRARPASTRQPGELRRAKPRDGPDAVQVLDRPPRRADEL